MKYAVLIAFGLSLGACASSGSQAEPEVAETDSEYAKQLAENRKKAGYKCEYVAVTGSKLKRKRCSTAAFRNYTHQKAREMMQQLNGAGCANTGGACNPDAGPGLRPSPTP